MDYSVAEMSCVLNASVQCEACKAKVQEILQNICGLYTITMDSDDGTVRICGRVNPRTFLKVIEKSGKHAEVRSIRFDGEVVDDRRSHQDPSNSYDLSYPRSNFRNCPQQSNNWCDRGSYYGHQPYPAPWQVMMPPPQPYPWPNPDDQMNPNNDDNNQNQRRCSIV